MADALPLELPGTRSTSSSPLVDVARAFADALPDLDHADRVLVVMVEQLATTIDAAARSGRASAAAMAARELREAIAHLQDRHAAAADDDPDAEFSSFRDFMLAAVERSGEGAA